jgi:hypothetical protein
MTMGIVNARITVDLGSLKAQYGKSTPNPNEDSKIKGSATIGVAKNTHT